MWYLLTPVLAGVLLGALGAPALRRTGRGPGARLDRRSATLTLAAAGVACLLVIALRALGVSSFSWGFPRDFPWELHGAVRFVLPLVLGIVMVLLLAVPARRTSVRSASLTRRTWRSFVSPARLAVGGGVLGAVLAITVAAGLASHADEDGHHTRYLVELGTASMETGFYGWHHSIAPLLCLAALTASAAGAWSAIARPPHPENHAQDVAARRLRSTNVARAATGAMLLHLSTVLVSLHGTAISSLTVHAESGEFFRSGVPFASLAPALQGGAMLAEAIGLGLWVLVALSAVGRSALPVRRSPSTTGVTA